MALPLLAKIGIGAGLAYFFGKSKDEGGAAAPTPAAPVVVQTPSGPVVVPVVPSPTQVPVAQRMATVLATGNPAAIRFEAGRLRQEGYPAQAAELEREAARLEQVAAPAVGPLPSGAVTSPGVPQKPPTVAAPTVPVSIPTPAGPVTVQLPQPTLPTVPMVPTTVQTPAGPVTVPLPAPATVPVTVQTPIGPVTVPALPPTVQLPVLAKGEVLSDANPGQKGSAKAGMWQAKLASLGLMQQSDVAAPYPYGPKTVAATKLFQGLANAWLKLAGPTVIPTTGEKISKLTVDGKLGNHTLGMAMLAHPPKGTGATATYFGSLDMGGGYEPQPASPLPGIIPPMAPKPIPPDQALASRLAFNLSTTSRGQEDRELVRVFQAHNGLKASGMYNASTGAMLAERYGIVPPTPRYWTDTHTRRSKANYRALLLRLGDADPQRAEEWQQAARSI